MSNLKMITEYRDTTDNIIILACFSSRSCRSDCNAPATFERLMDRVLQGLRWSRCLVYLDDIISFGSTFSDVLDNLTLIFERDLGLTVSS